MLGAAASCPITVQMQLQVSTVLSYPLCDVTSSSTHLCAALIIFESLITIGQEVKYFWSGKVTGAAVLFYLNRYLTLISFVDTMFGYISPKSDKVCFPLSPIPMVRVCSI